ncbi:hypothetical protein BU204_25530 [Actinophytocola xanthii]|uniref:Ig-like domain-containing protein n=1 Tax=Actinophytocola xanthii TaxID=1912961 RepID=A0A1Q8CK93_9PSEU|nr:hypothetical protein BU204_25530 [Actinophytocola xanthii]
MTALVVCGASAGVMLVAAAAPAGGEPRATAALGIRLVDEEVNGQCRVGDAAPGDVTHWTAENQWTRTLAIDTDDRPEGCLLYFGLNNLDGSLTGMKLTYTFQYTTGAGGYQCPTASPDPQTVPYLPLAWDYPSWASPIRINTHDDGGWCTLNLAISGRDDVGLDVLFEFVGDGGQCEGARQQGTNKFETVTSRNSVTIGLNSDDRAGACLLSFRLRHI